VSLTEATSGSSVLLDVFEAAWLAFSGHTFEAVFHKYGALGTIHRAAPTFNKTNSAASHALPPSVCLDSATVKPCMLV